ncbi:MAG TPA: hypothetical protein VG476_12620 [Acidimicrobiales bacterium]|nr:hypothetical protein [Acidimicrobiales bacterium]
MSYHTIDDEGTDRERMVIREDETGNPERTLWIDVSGDPQNAAGWVCDYPNGWQETPTVAGALAMCPCQQARDYVIKMTQQAVENLERLTAEARAKGDEALALAIHNAKQNLLGELHAA